MGLKILLQERLNHLKANLLCGYLARSANQYSVSAVQDGEDVGAVCSLLYRQYRRRGYCERSALRLHFSPYMFLDDSRTFILREYGQLLGTLSVFPDSAAGVPCEHIYPAEIQSLRERGISFAEVGLLATDLNNITIHGYALTSKHKMLPVFSLFKIMTNYALDSGISHLVIAVHPKHAELYRFFGFVQFGDEKNYDNVCGNPAVPMLLDLRSRAKMAFATVRKFFLRHPYAQELYSHQLANDPDAYARLFGESYYSFHEKFAALNEACEKTSTSSSLVIDQSKEIASVAG